MDIKKPLRRTQARALLLLACHFLIVFLARGSIPVVEHISHHPKVKGSSIAAAAGTERENDKKMY
jgi:hypothetical protein